MKIFLYVVNIGLAVSLLAWPLAVMMMHLSGGAGSNLWLKGFIVAVLLYPVPVVIGSKGAWKTRQGIDGPKLLKSTATGLVGPGLILFFLIELEIFCGGSASCR